MNPFIMGKNLADLIWDTQDLQRECEPRKTAPAALAETASYTRPEFFVRNLLQAAPTNRGTGRSALAEGARDGFVEYRQFETIFGQLHAEGFFPDGDLVSMAAKSLLAG
jgi:hypothetical protein